MMKRLFNIFSSMLPTRKHDSSAIYKERFRIIQETIVTNLDSLIIPDIRKRTGYTGVKFQFHWVYAEGEHIIEKCSEYRIPLP